MTTTRRQFLVGSGALIVGFTLAPRSDAQAPAVGAPAKPLALDDVDAFLAVGSDGVVHVYTGKVDLGTGTRTALRQIAAEELDVALDRVDLVEGDTSRTPDQGPTWGSLTVQVAGVQIRQAAATARRALLAAAAERLGAPAGDLEVKYGVVRLKRDPTKSTAYGELIGEREFRLKVDKEARLKDPATYTVVGTSVKRVDIPAKVTGEFTYMQDFRVPGMLHGRVVRPPALGATLVSVDESSVAAVKGLVRVVREGSFLGVVAESEWAAIQAAQALKATWSAWDGLPEMDRLWEVVKATPVAKDEETLKRGDAPAAMAGAVKRLSATYQFAIHMHASIGPSCAVADYKDGQLRLWSASQAPHWLRREMATMLGLPAERVRVQYVDGA
ncbi:MAG TPA: molybdopterin cofactor-binding domain-containing protein, partial [Methylomirabilota bacterium]|nr:molybdopterin cofactor-binding domain-containing protein [Methylomirabilota bacterium]